MGTFVVLLRAIGPITHKIMSMSQWREAVASAGLSQPETYLATGNMVVSADSTLPRITRQMDGILLELGLGTNNKAIVRTPQQLQALLRADPFPEASSERPAEVGVHFFAGPRPDFAWVRDFSGPERIHIEGHHLIVDYGGRGPTSGLPGMIERKSGLVTARNWNTVRGLVEKAAGRENQV